MSDMEASLEPDKFDAMYGEGAWFRIAQIINDLAPVTRRDDWWTTEGPYEILAMHLMKSRS